ncbi:MAG: hypothetical protein KKF41_15880 [Actinobacteria bacterium]|nr:hypothetical protein [Actinomycetota bacterium]MBU1944505.1 hypothetical protein [Actinomycetota bacterium]MBU2689058.1 hypothetical protein [Actinomycetota bacterium]
MRRKALGIAAVSLVLASAVLLLAPAAGQGQFDVTVYPAKMELTVAAGTSQPFEINVRNDSDAPQALKVYFMDYLIRPDNSFVFEEPGHYSYSCAKWLDTDSFEMLVQPGETAAKPFAVSVPADAEPGGHYGVIFFEQTRLPGEPAGQVQATGRIGVVTLITVPGEIIREGVIKDVQVNSAWWWPTRKLPLLPVTKIQCRVIFENKGNVHLTVKGKLTFTPSFGWGSGTVDLGEITVLPKTERYLEATLGEESKQEQNPASSAPVQPAAQPPFLGSYKVHAEVQYGPSLEVFDTTKTADSSSNVYPISLLVILLVVIALVILAFKLIKWWRSKKRARETEAAGEAVDTEKKEEISEELPGEAKGGKRRDRRRAKRKEAAEPEAGAAEPPETGDVTIEETTDGESGDDGSGPFLGEGI